MLVVSTQGECYRVCIEEDEQDEKAGKEPGVILQKIKLHKHFEET